MDDSIYILYLNDELEFVTSKKISNNINSAPYNNANIPSNSGFGKSISIIKNNQLTSKLIVGTNLLNNDNNQNNAGGIIIIPLDTCEATLPCDSSPCLNSATCVDGTASYTCTC